MKLYKLNLTMLIIFALSLMQISVFGQIDEPKPPAYPDLSKGKTSGSKGGPNDKLSPELRILQTQFDGSKGQGDEKADISFSDKQLKETFGIEAGEDDPKVSLAVDIKNDAEINRLKDVGMKVYMREGNTLYGEITVRRLGRLARESSVLKIASVKDVKSPPVPKNPTPPAMPNSSGSKGNGTTPNQPLANQFNKGTFTGKGVIVGVIDTGIDWTHPDFINADGTSRIIAIWDLFDESFDTSNGTIGSAPPTLYEDGDPMFGTVYTNAQINAALKNQGTVNTLDNNGHGTASAGTAAGNGRASNGQFFGVAPEADLIIVKAGDCGGISGAYIYGALWMVKTANEIKKPIVINQSFGGHYSAHDGTETEEAFLNKLTGKGIPGVIITNSAGNEGQYSFHAEGRFGKKTERGNEWSRPISFAVGNEETNGQGSILLGYFDAQDDWGIEIDAKCPTAYVDGKCTTGLVDKEGRPIAFYVYKHEGQIKYQYGFNDGKPDWFDNFALQVIGSSNLGTAKDELVLELPPGNYNIWGYGTSEKVVNGSFDFYAPFFNQVDFGKGTTRTGMVGSPGNASNVITVGAYNFRNNWTNNLNSLTNLNLRIGEISDYSSPGGFRENDKVTKPDIVSPATYTISPLSSSSKLNSEACFGNNMGGSGRYYVTSDEKYVAWQGTSASSPFTAGVIALMLQKNKTLDAEQVRDILKKTANKDGMIGAVPNPAWGNGMINPAKAILTTPLPTAKKSPKSGKK